MISTNAVDPINIVFNICMKFDLKYSFEAITMHYIEFRFTKRFMFYKEFLQVVLMRLER